MQVINSSAHSNTYNSTCTDAHNVVMTCSAHELHVLLIVLLKQLYRVNVNGQLFFVAVAGCVLTSLYKTHTSTRELTAPITDRQGGSHQEYQMTYSAERQGKGRPISIFHWSFICMRRIQDWQRGGGFSVDVIP